MKNKILRDILNQTIKNYMDVFSTYELYSKIRTYYPDFAGEVYPYFFGRHMVPVEAWDFDLKLRLVRTCKFLHRYFGCSQPYYQAIRNFSSYIPGVSNGGTDRIIAYEGLLRWFLRSLVTREIYSMRQFKSLLGRDITHKNMGVYGRWGFITISNWTDQLIPLDFDVNQNENLPFYQTLNYPPVSIF